jgi:multicomponent Na+:H+ antiporter subunit F
MTQAAGAVSALLIGIMLTYAVLVVLVLIRAVSGPKVADRLMAINMVGTIGIFLMAVVAVKLDEDYLLDISIIYAMISFLSVVILTKVYMGVHDYNVLSKHKKDMEAKHRREEDELDRLLREMEK